MFSLFMSILIVGLMSGVHMLTCPDEEDTYPCTCKEKSYEITVTCSRGFFLPFHPLKTLQLSLSKLIGKNNVILRLEGFNISIPSDFFSGIGIKRLEFHSCRIVNLTNDDQPALLGLENHLEALHIIDSSTVPVQFSLGHLKKLKYLTFQGNNITKIGRNVFSELNNLEELILTDNRFGPVKRSMFPTMARRLNKLNLNNNALTDLPVDIFSRMPAIEWLYLERNGITTLDELTWFPIWQRLYYVVLNGNDIVCDERLKWILKSKLRPRIVGECNSPKEFKGMELEDFTKSLRH